jgi:hypothetical protein
MHWVCSIHNLEMPTNCLNSIFPYLSSTLLPTANFTSYLGISLTSNAHSSAQRKHHATNILLNWQFHVPQKSAFHSFLALNSSVFLSYQGIILWLFYPPYPADKIIDLPNFYFTFLLNAQSLRWLWVGGCFYDKKNMRCVQKYPTIYMHSQIAYCTWLCWICLSYVDRLVHNFSICILFTFFALIAFSNN